MHPIILPADTPVWLQIVIAAIVVVSLYAAVRAWRRNGRLWVHSRRTSIRTMPPWNGGRQDRGRSCGTPWRAAYGRGFTVRRVGI